MTSSSSRRQMVGSSSLSRGQTRTRRAGKPLRRSRRHSSYGVVRCPSEGEAAMVSKYDRLTSELRAAAERGQRTVDLDFDEVDALVGGLPASAVVRQWWANSAQV